MYDSIIESKKPTWATFYRKSKPLSMRIDNELYALFRQRRQELGIRSDRQMLEMILRAVLYKPDELLRKLAREKIQELTIIQEMIREQEKQRKLSDLEQESA